MSDLTEDLKARVDAAIAERMPLRLIGGNSKAFYGRTPVGEPLQLAGHRGIVSYEPTELVITARAGTPLAEIERVLAEHGQMLPFEPPHFGASATLGGTLACNLSGPRRAYAGAARDYLLGTRIINGKAEVLRFGGEVMKNVAGYDVSRLMAGAMGTLGVVLEASLKVLPRPDCDTTLVREMTLVDALECMNQWAGRPLPLSATAYLDGRLYLRLSGMTKAVRSAQAQLGGEPVAEGEAFWRSLREHQLEVFTNAATLWRLSLPAHAPAVALGGHWVVEWGGAQRWLAGNEDGPRVRAAARAIGGHATLFRGGDRSQEVFTPLDEGLAKLHRKLKHAFDPQGIFNPGRMYADL